TLQLQQEPVSLPYIHMTLHVMKSFGIFVQEISTQENVTKEIGTQENVTQNEGTMSRKIEYLIPKGIYSNPKQFVVEADSSSASYFLALGALTRKCVTVTNLFPSESTQGDSQ